jgi:GNAT superfamily N-acetyltransferase
MNWSRGNFTISTDPARLQPEVVVRDLHRQYWATTRPPEVTQRALEHSLCFGVYDGNAQIGLARVITDYAAFAYLCDVYILEDYRGQGLGKWLVECVLEHPELRTVRRFLLVTSSAAPLYAQFGFTGLEKPEEWMQRIQEW